MLICEHGGRAVPHKLKKLGLHDAAMDEHIAYDIGAEATARLLANELSVPLVIQRYSRLVIDCNRPPTADDAMPHLIHGTTVPGNENLSAQSRQQRVQEIFTPFDHAVAELIEAPKRRWAFSIHSFTPELNGQMRPWDIGFLFRNDDQTSALLAEHIRLKHPNITVGLNEPYTIDDESDWFVPQHAERLNLQHSLVEIRNDHICTEAGQHFWARLLTDAINSTLN